jgi:tetratricopeptide (TPR) repeat protein
MTSLTTLTADAPSQSSASRAVKSRSGSGPAIQKPFRSPGEMSLLVSLLLALGTVAIYASSMRNGFVSLDDRLYLTQNPTVLGGLSWADFIWAFRTTTVDYWHPLTWLLHMADVQMFGLRPAGHHLVSLLLHVVNVVLLFHVLHKATGSLARSAVVAALFAACPLNVESVAWVAETKTLLCTAFFLLALWAYGWYARRPGAARYLSVLALFVLGLMAKPMLVTFPAALLLLDYWPLDRTRPLADATPASGAARASWLRLILEKIPMLALSLASALSTIVSQRAAGAVINTARYPVSWRVKNVIWSYADYLFKAIWPFHLAAFYPYEGHTLSLAKVIAAAALLLLISALVWRFRQRKYLAAGWLWYLLNMLPVIGIVQAGSQGMADRYAYVTFWGLFAAVVWLVTDLAKDNALPRQAVAASAACVLLAYSALAFAQVRTWHDSFSLFAHAAAVVPQNAFAEENLGELFVDAGRPQDALPHYEAAAQYMPSAAVVHYNLGAILQGENRLAEAAREYNLAILYETGAPMLWTEYDNLGGTYARMNRVPDAIVAFSQAIKLDPNLPLAYKNRGLAEYAEGDDHAALHDFARSAALAPDAQTYYWMAGISETQGDAGSAEDDYEAALRIDPGFSNAQSRLNALKKTR